MMQQVPWITGNLFNGPLRAKAAAVEVRACIEEVDGNVQSSARTECNRPNFWGVYLVDAEGMPDCVADMPTEAAADAIAEAVMHAYALPSSRGLRSVVTRFDVTESAACLWEAALQMIQEHGTWTERDDGSEVDDIASRISDYSENNGYGELRRWICDVAAPAAHVEFITAETLHGYHECFDWHFCPKFLRESVDWGPAEQGYNPTLKAGVYRYNAAPAAKGAAPIDRLDPALKAWLIDEMGMETDSNAGEHALLHDGPDHWRIVVTRSDCRDLPAPDDWHVSASQNGMVRWASTSGESLTLRQAVGAACAIAAASEEA